ncbi:3-isopropylmalate dehydratase [Burkholderia pseudomallei]|nr:3-isopropylmalate dehydratase [Burkholderia pseudomallei]
MGKNITEKILARAAGLPEVSAGDEILAHPSSVLAYDFPGVTDMFFRQMKEDFQVARVPRPERFAIFIDHMVPAAQPKEEKFHEGTRAWCRDNGVQLLERKGIGHQVATEMGYAVPGDLVLHHDGHVSQIGAFGTLAFGIRRNLIEAFISDKVRLQVPKTTRVELTGTLRKGVMARDLFHHMVRAMGPASCAFHVLELGGPAIAEMSMDGLQCICGLAMFLGALTAIVNPDERILSLARQRTARNFEPLYSDADADYAATHTFDLGIVEPVVVVPPTPENTRDLRDYIGLELNAGYLGSCVSGRLEDLEIAASILRGHTVKPGFSLHVVPTSQDIMAEAGRRGYLSDLVEAGAFVSSPTCDYCYGHIATMAEGQRAVSTGTLNVRGRMGSMDSEIYLASAATVAASAIEGRLTDPRDFL